jgi:excisionase family DNA binding protein
MDRANQTGESDRARVRRSRRAAPRRHPRALPDPATEPTIDVDRAARILGISRRAAYDAVKRGEIPSRTFGRRICIPTAQFLRFLDPGPEPTPTRRQRTARR